MTTRIIVSAETDQGLEAPISPHFGHCPYFTVVDVEGKEIRAVGSAANPYSAGHQPGEIPAFVQGLGAQVMLSGGMGGRAIALFEEYGIQPATGATGTVSEALTRYLNGDLDAAAPCSESVEHGHG
ncbi:MAG: NifB/NifX family molybdenum-iron cluster-binding protein [Anaerolineae bacterium]|jgi:predicted Fe-Mo cluster-binding NifX family protein|nr:NifB/NifX family molybdenum-iron cluster-binding protein [Anaerolineae bacterium]